MIGPKEIPSAYHLSEGYSQLSSLISAYNLDTAGGLTVFFFMK